MILTPEGVPFHPLVVIGLGKNLLFKSVLAHCTKVRFASFLSGGFTTMAAMNPPERKLSKRTFVCIGCMILQRCDGIKLNGIYFRPTTFNPGSFTESGYSVSVSAFTDGGRFQTTCYETKHGMLITIMYLLRERS